MISNKSIEERIVEMEEMEISNQVIDDQNWKILRKFRKSLDGKTGKYQYFLLIQCNKCGHIQLIGASSIHRSKIPCHRCILKECEGEIYGPYKILQYDHSEEKQTPSRKVFKHYYKVQCTKCGQIYIKEKNAAQWSKYTRCNCCNMANPDNPGISTFYADYKYSAKARDIDWNLPYAEFEQLIFKNCHYCGSVPKERIINKKSKIIVNGIDRVDSSKGYSANNCVPCCTMCNLMKSDYSIGDFLNHVNLIHTYSLIKGSTTIENTSNDGSEQSTTQANGVGNGGNPEKD